MSGEATARGRAVAGRAVFLCPLCRDGGRPMLLEAEIQRDGDLLVVADLRGCRHAARLGNLERLTIDQEWRLIEAARGAHDAATATTPSG